MSETEEVSALEQAIQERAESLVTECRARGREEADRIREEGNERLRLRENREIQAAKAQADQLYRRRVQASELAAEKELDRLRWSLIQEVMATLSTELEAVVADETRYLSLFRDLLRGAGESIGESSLVVQVSERDRPWLASSWATLTAEELPGYSVHLDPEPIATIGGPRVRNEANTVRVDATFEARMDRLGDELVQRIMERLFAQALYTRDLLYG